MLRLPIQPEIELKKGDGNTSHTAVPNFDHKAISYLFGRHLAAVEETETEGSDTPNQPELISPSDVQPPVQRNEDSGESAADIAFPTPAISPGKRFPVASSNKDVTVPPAGDFPVPSSTRMESADSLPRTHPETPGVDDSISPRTAGVHHTVVPPIDSEGAPPTAAHPLASGPAQDAMPSSAAARAVPCAPSFQFSAQKDPQSTDSPDSHAARQLIPEPVYAHSAAQGMDYTAIPAEGDVHPTHLISVPAKTSAPHLSPSADKLAPSSQEVSSPVHAEVISGMNGVPTGTPDAPSEVFEPIGTPITVEQIQTRPRSVGSNQRPTRTSPQRTTSADTSGKPAKPASPPGIATSPEQNESTPAITELKSMPGESTATRHAARQQNTELLGRAAGKSTETADKNVLITSAGQIDETAEPVGPDNHSLIKAGESGNINTPEAPEHGPEPAAIIRGSAQEVSAPGSPLTTHNSHTNMAALDPGRPEPARAQTPQPIQLVQQIADAIAGQENLEARELIVHCEPPELGKVRLVLHSEAGTVNTTIQVERHDLRDILQRHVGDLRGALDEVGVTIGECTVELGGRPDTGPDSRFTAAATAPGTTRPNQDPEEFSTKAAVPTPGQALSLGLNLLA